MQFEVGEFCDGRQMWTTNSFLNTYGEPKRDEGVLILLRIEIKKMLIFSLSS